MLFIRGDFDIFAWAAGPKVYMGGGPKSGDDVILTLQMGVLQMGTRMTPPLCFAGIGLEGGGGIQS